MKSDARQCVFVMLHIKAWKKVLEVGCGDGFCSLNLAGVFPEAEFLGVDTVSRHVAVANRAAEGVNNVHFQQHDILSDSLGSKYCVVFGVVSLLHGHYQEACALHAKGF